MNNFLSDLENLDNFLPRSEKTKIPKSLPTNDLDFLASPRNVKLALQIMAAYTARMKDALSLYRPLPGPATKFHESMARIRLISGSNQAGKTLTAEAEFARICRGKDPFSKRKVGGLKMLAVGKDLAHVGQVMWRKLYWTGAFDCITDLDTGAIRAVRPCPSDPSVIDPTDLARKSEWMPSPPLIPDYDIAGMSWESKGEGIPSIVHMRNGTEIMFRTSKGSPPNGIQLDVAHFDEEIENKQWLPEILPRLLRFGGIFFWSATPQAQTPQFFALHRRFLDGEEGIDEFSLLVTDNPYLDPASKEALRRDLLALGEDEYAVRWLGKYAIQGREVYPTYDLRTHGIDIARVPDNWMLVVAIDPGSALSAFLILAVPPGGGRLYVLEECELKNKDAEAMAKELKTRLNGRRPEAYVIDKRAGVQHSIGRNDRVCDHYAKEFNKIGVPPAVQNPGGFVFGCDIPAARELSVKRFLNSDPKRLLFRKGFTSRLDRQIRNRFYDQNDGDKREKRTIHDLCDCLEYGAAFFDDVGLYYNAPPQKIAVMTEYDMAVYESLLKKKKRGWKLS
jgi:hypothetical protein